MRTIALTIFCLLFLQSMQGQAVEPASMEESGQEVINLGSGDLKGLGIIELSKLEGWIFTQSMQADWFAVDADTRNWIKNKTTEMSFELANQDGLVEVWFRLKFRVDTSLAGQQIYFNLLPLGAASMYLNGKLYDEAGYPDSDPGRDRPSIDYLSRINKGWLPDPVKLDTSVYTIAVHYTDHDRSKLAKYSYRNMGTGFNVNLFTPDLLESHIRMGTEYKFFSGFWLNGILLLTFLFAMLLMLNKKDVVLRWIALLTLSLAASAITDFLNSNIFTGIWSHDLQDLFYYEFIALAVGFIPLAVSQIMTNRTDRRLFYLFGVLSLIYPVVWYFSGFDLVRRLYYFLMGGALLIVAGVCVNIIVANRKKLGRAEWSLIWGLIVTVSWMLVHTIFINVGFGSNVYRLMTVTMIYLSLPISFLIYISIRYSDNISVLQNNIREISKLTKEKLKVQEEKQKLVLSQNVILEKKVKERTRELSEKNTLLSDANQKIQKQRDEVISSKKKLEKTLIDLKSTQAQLIHAEKMSSLGELTAGIAHEIQNPLNFVNNFSEVSMDLIEELNEELKKGDAEEVNSISADLLQNLEKINNHGKRASNIVKSMLEHSRTGSGVKVPTDLNALADEFLRLAYHGLRAKDKSFNADFNLEADASLPKINVVPQDIGRVLLNLINNAFYAVNEKVKQNLNDFKPLVVLTTSMGNNMVIIKVRDNGNGIPDSVKNKIFQPFFTTKPTGQGTGLGLSMSYDIITQGHGGSVEVNSTAGEGSEFIIHLPV